MAMPLALGITAPVAGRLADRLGARSLTIGGMATVAGGLALLGALRPSTPGFLLLLAVVGIGLGLFTPPNNAAIMGSVPQGQSGLASGVLNMTRGMGTAFGLALTGLVFDVAGGRSSVSSSAAHAFSVTALFLAAVAVVAGVIAGLREGGPLERSMSARISRGLVSVSRRSAKASLKPTSPIQTWVR